MQHIYPNLEDWPIYKLSEKRAQHVEEINSHTYHALKDTEDKQLYELLNKTIYLEKQRVKSQSWPVDPPNEALFWLKLERRLGQEVNINQPDSESRLVMEELLRIIINRYSQEIVGSFKINTFIFARKFLTLFFNIIFNPLRGKYALSLWLSKKLLLKKLVIYGQVELIRKLTRNHIVVIVPTHSSNLDSILIGYVLDSKMGLPGFAYGAGLNLYNSGIAAYFMNRLGAYRLDRRKKNAVYLETLKTMSHLSISSGTNSLFFPEGTRSRSNLLEDKIKLGLLGTTIDAQRNLCETESEKKVIIVPMILNNHFVLEAKSLVEQHLKISGKEQYQRDRKKSGILTRLFYWLKFFKHDTEVVFSFGKPIDVFGNPVDENGTSTHINETEINVCDYFKINERIVDDPQRENEYTRILANHISGIYKKYSVILDSQIMAFVCFHIIRERYKTENIFQLFKVNTKDLELEWETVLRITDETIAILKEMEYNGELQIDPRIVNKSSSEIIISGIKNCGSMHIRKPMVKTGNIIKTEDLRLLYFYSNRLSSFKISDRIDWSIISDKVELFK
jgi:glycerol-3-phosphate O-acyltransferase